MLCIVSLKVIFRHFESHLTFDFLTFQFWTHNLRLCCTVMYFFYIYGAQWCLPRRYIWATISSSISICRHRRHFPHLPTKIAQSYPLVRLPRLLLATILLIQICEPTINVFNSKVCIKAQNKSCISFLHKYFVQLTIFELHFVGRHFNQCDHMRQFLPFGRFFTLEIYLGM
jgi:hypothetical protein